MEREDVNCLPPPPPKHPRHKEDVARGSQEPAGQVDEEMEEVVEEEMEEVVVEEEMDVGQKVEEKKAVGEKVEEKEHVGEKVEEKKDVGEKVEEKKDVGEKVEEQKVVGEKVEEKVEKSVGEEKKDVEDKVGEEKEDLGEMVVEGVKGLVLGPSPAQMAREAEEVDYGGTSSESSSEPLPAQKKVRLPPFAEREEEKVQALLAKRISPFDAEEAPLDKRGKDASEKSLDKMGKDALEKPLAKRGKVVVEEEAALDKRAWERKGHLRWRPVAQQVLQEVDLAVDWYQTIRLAGGVPKSNVEALHRLKAAGFRVHLLSFAGPSREREVRKEVSSLDFLFASLNFVREKCGRGGKVELCQRNGWRLLVDDNHGVCSEAWGTLDIQGFKIGRWQWEWWPTLSEVAEELVTKWGPSSKRSMLGPH